MFTIRSLKELADDERGATAIEYALISSLIALVLVAALTNLGSALSTEFSEVSGVLK
jgi:pilus assembly protein Flp/PilA